MPTDNLASLAADAERRAAQGEKPQMEWGEIDGRCWSLGGTTFHIEHKPIGFVVDGKYDESTIGFWIWWMALRKEYRRQFPSLLAAQLFAESLLREATRPLFAAEIARVEAERDEASALADSNQGKAAALDEVRGILWGILKGSGFCKEDASTPEMLRVVRDVDAQEIEYIKKRLSSAEADAEARVGELERRVANFKILEALLDSKPMPDWTMEVDEIKLAPDNFAPTDRAYLLSDGELCAPRMPYFLPLSEPLPPHEFKPFSGDYHVAIILANPKWIAEAPEPIRAMRMFREPSKPTAS